MVKGNWEARVEKANARKANAKASKEHAAVLSRLQSIRSQGREDNPVRIWYHLPNGEGGDDEVDDRQSSPLLCWDYFFEGRRSCRTRKCRHRHDDDGGRCPPLSDFVVGGYGGEATDIQAREKGMHFMVYEEIAKGGAGRGGGNMVAIRYMGKGEKIESF